MRRSRLVIGVAVNMFTTAAVHASAADPSISVSLNTSVTANIYDGAGDHIHSDPRVITSGFDSSGVSFDDVPESGWLDPASAHASAFNVSVASEVFTNPLAGSGPVSNASLNGSRIRVTWPSDLGPPSAYQLLPDVPPYSLKDMYLPVRVHGFLGGTLGSGLFKSTTGQMSFGASVATFSGFSDQSPLGTIMGQTSVDGNMSFGINGASGERGGSAAGVLGEFLRSTQDLGSTGIYEFSGVINLPLLIVKETMPDGSVSYPPQDYQLSVSIGAQTDSLAGHAISRLSVALQNLPAEEFVYATKGVRPPGTELAADAVPDSVFVPVTDLGATVTFLPAPVPEPAPLLASLLLVGWVRLRRRLA